MPRRVAALASLILSGLFVFNGSFLFAGPGFALKFPCIPFVAWAAFELHRHELPLAIIAFSGLAIGSAFLTNASPITNESLLLLQIFLGVLATTVLLISAAVWERNRHEQGLREARTDLEVRVAERTRELEKRVEEQKRTELALQGLSARLLHVQDQERRRIARELHDSTGQSLVSMIMTLSQLAKALADTHPELSARLEQMSEIARGVSDEVRTTSYLLHPPLLDDAGLKSALAWYGQGYEERSKIKVTLDVSDNLGRLPPDIEIMVFRAVQESLTNVHRHSKSKTVDIRVFRSADALTLEIEDQGLGILPDKLKAIAESRTAGVGVRGMRERFTAVGGELNILSEGHGTLVRGVVPLKPNGLAQPSSDEQPAVGISRE
jgi:signal transduction histidine kinase